MRNPARFVAVDRGASSGRMIAARWDGRRFKLDEIPRFNNGGVQVGDRLYWDVLQIWSNLLAGLTRFRSLYEESPVSIGIDGWGIDLALLDDDGRMLSNPVHYRDKRTEGVPEKFFEVMEGEALFRETGLQPWRINTLFQLYSMVLAEDSQLKCARTLLTVPDLLSYFLSGAAKAEYTEASTTQLYSLPNGIWAHSLLDAAGVPGRILPEVVRPGSALGNVRSEVLSECGFSTDFSVVAVASHDTASAVAAIPNLDPSSAFISSGTWSLIGTEIERPDTSNQAYALGFTNEVAADGRFLLLKNLAGLWMIQACLRKWEKEGQLIPWSGLLSAAASATAFISLVEPNEPCFDLEPDMPSAICRYCARTGQRIPEAPGAFARALFESLALKYRSVLSSIEQLVGRRLTCIRVVGGGSRNALLCQMIADACNRTVFAGPAEATSLGNVMMQAIAADTSANSMSARSCPIPANANLINRGHPRIGTKPTLAFNPWRFMPDHRRKQS